MHNTKRIFRLRKLRSSDTKLRRVRLVGYSLSGWKIYESDPDSRPVHAYYAVLGGTLGLLNSLDQLYSYVGWPIFYERLSQEQYTDVCRTHERRPAPPRAADARHFGPAALSA